MNLTAIESEVDIISKHFVDSLAAFKIFQPRPGLRVLDVGSGAGFPGMVLKLQAPELAVTLLEPSTKKSAFLHHLVGTLGVPGLIIKTERIEAFRDSGFDLIICRALKADIVLGAARPLLNPSGKLLLYRVAPLIDIPYNYQIVKQISFLLPFVDAPRTLTLLKPTGNG
jgi:16S rRNA (guanine527-N7)-methyltransferase